MHRRRYLARLGAAGALGVAGCLGDDSTPGSGDTPTPDSDGSTATDHEGTPTDTATPAATPGTDAPFPPDSDDTARVVWYRQVSDPDGRLHLAHSAATAPLPGRLSVTLTNPTDRRFMTNFYDWALYRWERGRYHRVAPREIPEPLMSLAPGESHTWTLSLRQGGLEAPAARTGGTDEVTVAPVGGGTYAFAVSGWWEDQTETPTYEHQTVAAARFEVTGPELQLVPSAAVTGTSHDGDTVVVTAENPDGGDTPATYVLTRDEDAPDPRTVVTEQVYRQWPLRDALAHAADASEVRVETTTVAVPPFGVQADEDPAVTYDGRTYRITAENGG